jgi:FkbM family methyltransferase
MGKKFHKNNKHQKSSSSSSSSHRHKVCLNMIVKNEAHVIHECLESVVHLVDYYVINDTGSTDNTKQVIREFFDRHNIKGEIIDHEFRTCKCHGPEYKKYDWFHFGWNRSYALDKCRGKADYIFIMDADDIVEGSLKFPPKLDADQYYLHVRTDYNHYQKPLLIRNDPKLKWRWECGLHEFLTGEAKTTYRLIGDYAIISRRLGDRNKDPLKYYKDAAVLEELIRDFPNEIRYKYYYAQSWFDAKEYEKAIAEYKKVIDECYEYDKDRAYSCYYMMGRAHILKNAPIEEIENVFAECQRKFKHRAEPAYQLCSLFSQRGEYQKAYDYGVKGLGLSSEIQTAFYIDKSIYEYKLLDEMVFCASELKRYSEALKWAEQMEKENKYPKESYEALMENIFALRNLIKTENQEMKINTDINKPSLCFYVGPSPIHRHQKFGSELAVIYLANELKKWYNVFVIGDECKFDPNDDIIYLPPHFLQERSFDIMIVSRYVNYFVEYDVKRVANKTFIWLHDTHFHPRWNNVYLPIGSLVKNIDHLVDGYIALSPWHKQHILSEHRLDPDKIHIIGNGISKECFNVDISYKVPNKFIWVSQYDRGLMEYINQFHKILRHIPDAHLDIYRDLPAELIDIYKKLPFIHLKGQATNSEILRGFAESDYWYYPTTWPETFCISGLEAQAMGCVCIGSDLAALNTTIGDYGILMKKRIGSEEFWNEGLDAILKCHRDAEYKKDLVLKARERARGETWDNVVHKWLTLFDGTMIDGNLFAKRITTLKTVYGFSPKLAFDIGANVGEWNINFRKMFPGCRVISFEANSNCVRELKRKNIEYVEGLLGAKDGAECEFYLSNEMYPGGASIYREKTTFYNDDIIITEKMKMRTLETVLKNCDENLLSSKIDLIKIDVQGAELDILRGANDVLKNTDFILLEISLMTYNENSPLFAEVIEFMNERNFALYDILEFHYLQGCCLQIDGLFLNKNSKWTSKIATQNSEKSYWKVKNIYE